MRAKDSKAQLLLFADDTSAAADGRRQPDTHSQRRFGGVGEGWYEAECREN